MSKPFGTCCESVSKGRKIESRCCRLEYRHIEPRKSVTAGELPRTDRGLPAIPYIWMSRSGIEMTPTAVEGQVAPRRAMSGAVRQADSRLPRDLLGDHGRTCSFIRLSLLARRQGVPERRWSPMSWSASGCRRRRWHGRHAVRSIATAAAAMTGGVEMNALTEGRLPVRPMLGRR